MDPYTAVTNTLFDEWMEHLTDHELRVAMHVIRHTIGYHRDAAPISSRQFATCGVAHRTRLRAAIDGLCRKGLLTVHRNTANDGGNAASTYSIVVPHRYQAMPDPNTMGVPGRPPLVPGRPRGGVPDSRSDRVPGRHPIKEIKKGTGGIDPGPIWEKAKAWLATEMSGTNYRLWIEDTALLALTPTRATVEAAHAQAADWLQERWVPLLERALGEALERSLGQAPRVVITTRPAPLSRTADGP